MKKFIDKFGEHFESWPSTDHSFQAKVTASISRTFYSWLFQYNGEINIVSPDDIQAEYIQMLTTLADTAKKYI